MNSRSLLSITLATALVAGAALTTHAQTWVTVDDYQYPPGGLTAVSGEIGADGFGNVYAVGRGTPLVACDERAILRGSSNRGTNWVALDDYQEVGFHGGHYRAFAAGDASGHLLVGGHIDPANDCVGQGNAAWIIRESFNGGITWSPADVPDPFQNNAGGSCADLKIHPSGDVYAAGGSANAGWVVRKRSAGTPDFLMVEPALGNPEQVGRAFATAFHPGGAVFVVGEHAGPSGPVWTVRRSMDNGNNWTTADSFRNGEWTSGSAQGIAVTESGTIYVAGWAYYSSRSKSGNRWVVRTSTDGGNTWSISDNFGSGGVSGGGVVVDANGKPYVCGYGNGYWLVRALNEVTTIKKGKPVTTQTWTTIDSFQLASGQAARANGITIDIAGNIYVSGSAHDESAVAHWIVRKPSATP